MGGFKLKCCNEDDRSQMLLREKNILEKSVSELTESSFLQDQHIIKLKNMQKEFLDEASQREEELNIYIQKQTETLEKANEEINKLRKHIADFTSKQTSSKFTQTATNKTVTRETQTSNATKEDRTKINAQTTVLSEIARKQENKLSKVLLVSGSHGKDLVHFLRRHLETFSTFSIVKPNASNSELLKTVTANAKYFTKEDIILFWPNINSSWLLRNLCSELTHTNFIIINTPNDFRLHLNEKIYQSNIALYKKVHELQGNLTHVFNVNSFLRKSNYDHSGRYINKLGKKHISLHLVNKIKKLIPCKISTQTDNDNVYNAEIKSPTGVQEESENQVRNFLYPRLSQELFQQM